MPPRMGQDGVAMQTATAVRRGRPWYRRICLRWFSAAAVGLTVLAGCGAAGTSPTTGAGAGSGTVPACQAARAAFDQHRSHVWLTVGARVDRLLADAHGRYTHQRFIVQCASGQTVLVVNDVSIGQRAPVSVGDAVTVSGEYIWDSKGGLIHFTHHDPEHALPGGYIRVGGHQYS